MDSGCSCFFFFLFSPSGIRLFRHKRLQQKIMTGAARLQAGDAGRGNSSFFLLLFYFFPFLLFSLCALAHETEKNGGKKRGVMMMKRPAHEKKKQPPLHLPQKAKRNIFSGILDESKGWMSWTGISFRDPFSSAESRKVQMALSCLARRRQISMPADDGPWGLGFGGSLRGKGEGHNSGRTRRDRDGMWIFLGEAFMAGHG
ncbi:hypothetical protein LZ31DRAFT_288011 [Colletotrichum somersetense]|nr:hypothetical protein LZ31DRAFT_288011 [Colletotrichum somersetense]